MDIYSFINSPDISEYCRKIKKAWTPFEMAVIIGISKRSMAEKLTAWRELIKDYPDMPTPEGYHHNSYPSLHKKLKEAIAYEELYAKRAYEILKKTDPDALYAYKIGENDWESVFTDFDLAFSDMQNRYERREAPAIEIMKFYLNDPDNHKGKVEACLDYDGNLISIDVCASEELLKKWFPNGDYRASLLFREDFYVIIPTPFKRGDILTIKNYVMGKEPIIFVLESIDYENPKARDRRLHYQGDRTDMTASGYFMYGDGVLTQELITPYSGCEYYRGNLEGEDRLLQYVSWYLRDEIALPALLMMQSRIMLKHHIETVLNPNQWYFPKEHIIADGQVEHEN